MTEERLEAARALYRLGATREQILALLRTKGATPIECIKALQELEGLSLADAKHAMHTSECWSDLRSDHDRLHAEAESILNQVGRVTQR
jgi:ribosomal protein L7/L12